ncbi:heme lyase CcmF/NrfE family subunit [Moritella sp. Urea-trap-13]|uniref:heme lyase CcmF/NrfE family subunit n=1 Tax=Moritella sp. Urea-trap-13 TaxID=2058327 RepID=UPI000C32F44C|nr:heme lyase CcmF/NrfE family subunit [Moritella sp. Urea-trap-13]PKH06086.1 heme lyase NrfEFG subunit NrfE [Moritella sp. Urea-trap-13]
MIPEIALFSLILGTLCAILGAAIPLFGIVTKRPQLSRYSWSLSYAAFIAVTTSICLLAYSFTVDDFSVNYIAQHSNSQLPVFFKIAAVWGGHEGSLLFWVFSLSLWSAAIAFVNRNHNQAFISRVLIVLSLLTAAFGLFTLLGSNPFSRLFPVPMQGRDLHPMLQDVGLIFHPPLLYLGYVGFSGAFAFAVAALTMPDINIPWPQWSRAWTLAAWVMLTGGVALGSWWAYYELGWGGWWFWDPVENASLLPWLTGTALLHSLIASEKRQALINWSLLLSIFTFSLSLLGTFVVRSGILTSVHAFAVDPTRGLVLLVILAICVVVPLTLFMLQSGKIKPLRLQSIVSREVLFLVLNGLLVVATLSVLLGTFYPMIFQVLNLASISVGAPFFNTVFVPLALLCFMLMCIAPFIHWQKTHFNGTKIKLVLVWLASVIIGSVASYLFNESLSLYVLLVLILCVGIVMSTLLAGVSMGNLAMTVAHIGVAITAVGILLVSFNSTEMSAKMSPGSTVKLGDLTISYVETQWLVAANYTAEQAVIDVVDNNGDRVQLKPQKRHYPVRVMNMSEPAIHSTWLRDIYITMGEKIDRDAYAIRVQNKAFINWLWAGSMMMMLGGMLAIGRRYAKS